MNHVEMSDGRGGTFRPPVPPPEPPMGLLRPWQEAIDVSDATLIKTFDVEQCRLAFRALRSEMLAFLRDPWLDADPPTWRFPTWRVRARPFDWAWD